MSVRMTASVIVLMITIVVAVSHNRLILYDKSRDNVLQPGFNFHLCHGIRENSGKSLLYLQNKDLLWSYDDNR